MSNIQIKYENNQMLVASKQIAEHFKKRHDHVLRDIETIKKDLPDFGEMFYETQLPDSYGRSQKAYLMNRDGFTLLAMGFTGKDALEWKVKYIQAFNEMEKKLNDPEFLVQRSMQYLQDKCNALLLENTEKDKEIQRMKPKEVFADAVNSSEQSILIGELAKLINQNGVDIGQNRLFQWMRENDYLISSGQRRNQPTQRAMDMGLFEIKERTINNPDGSIRITLTTKVTGKGQIYFVNKFCN